MKNIFISNITIANVRHLKNINIALSETEKKHLILTGRNGSGKTSILNALAFYLHSVSTDGSLGRLLGYATKLNLQESKMILEFNESQESLRDCFEEGQFILAYYKAERSFMADIPEHVEKVALKDKYAITEEPHRVFIKYLLDLKVTEALARNGSNLSKAENIRNWFEQLQDLLRKVFEDETLELIFDEDTFRFFIKMKDRELFDFNTLSDGYAAIFNIVLDLIVRMEKNVNKSFNFNMPGIVLIDEIETHLHLELQRVVLELLTTVFPNIQFIVSTHSPFILSSLDDVVIYDLERNIMVPNGLANVPYAGIVEGYFNADSMSSDLKKKYDRYKELVAKDCLTDADFEEVAELELFLNEIPDYLALGITTEYQRVKMEFENRKDI